MISIDLTRVSYFFEIYLCSLGYFLFLEKRRHFLLRLLLAAALSAVFAGLFSMALFPSQKESFGTNLLWYLLVYISNIFLCLFCVKTGLEEAVYAVSCGSLTQYIASSAYILWWGNRLIPSFTSWNYYILLLVLILLAAFFFASRFPKEGHYDISRAEGCLTFIMTLSITLGLCFLAKNIAKEEMGAGPAGDGRPFFDQMFLTTQVYAIVVSLLFLVLQLLQRKRVAAIRQGEASQALWRQRQQQYELTKETIDLINKKCHDMKHQIAALAAESRPDKSMKSQALTGEFTKLVEVYDSHVDTGNEVLDTLLMDKGLYCGLHGIEWTVMADGSLLNFMDPVDLYILLGNAFDNAVEAVEKLPGGAWKRIFFTVKKKNNFIAAKVENTYDGCIPEEDKDTGSLLSSKKESWAHGYGTKSMKEVVQKYKGSLVFRPEEKIFVMLALFPARESQM